MAANSKVRKAAVKPGIAKQQGITKQQGIPKQVANRMARRVAICTGIPSLLGMAVFVASYLLVVRAHWQIPPLYTLAISGCCFLVGLAGLSYGLFSSSWIPEPGSLLGFEQIGSNIKRLRGGATAPQNGLR